MPRPDYSDHENWIYFNEGSGKTADLFIVGPTVDFGENGNTRADMNDTKFRLALRAMVNTMVGIYNTDAAVYSPYYRQIAFPTYKLPERDTALAEAYKDVRDAFLYYSKNSDSRPLILAGFSQGSDMILRLIEEFFSKPQYHNRFVAAYCIGWKIPKPAKPENIRPAVGETDTGVVISFNTEAEDVTASWLVGEDEKTYSINPLNWCTDTTKACRSMNKGACFVNFLGAITREVPALTGAYIDEKRGTLKVTDIDPSDLDCEPFPKGVYHLYDYQFFYRDLQENVKKRLTAFIAGTTS